MDEKQIMMYKIEAFKSLLTDAYFAAKKAVAVLFKDSDDFKTQNIAQMHLSNATSAMYSAKAVYISDYEDLARNDLEDIFHAFDVFKEEFLSNVTTGHSHQWTKIEYDDFLRSLKAFGNGIPVDFDD